MFFLEKLANVLLEQTGAKKSTIELEPDKQPLYGPIYNLDPVELETLKTYIETNLANGFIRASNIPASTPIHFGCKSNNSFCLCVDYQGLNNFIIKNWYVILRLIRLSQTIYFT